MKNWKTSQEAEEQRCQQTFSPDLHDEYQCIDPECGHWLWRPCPYCSGDGIRGLLENERTTREAQFAACSFCTGTGHDESGLGRCGLINGI